MVNHKRPDLGIPNRINLNSSRFSVAVNGDGVPRRAHAPNRPWLMTPAVPALVRDGGGVFQAGGRFFVGGAGERWKAISGSRSAARSVAWRATGAPASRPASSARPFRG